MTHPFLLKVACYTRLSGLEQDQLCRILGERIRMFDPRQEMMREGAPPDRLFVLLDGWAYRYKHLPDGRRQIMSFLLPGDLCDSHMLVLELMDHSVGSLSPVTASELRREDLLTIVEGSPRLAKALWWDALVSTSIQREWTVSVGRRDAMERMAHLFVELLFRLRSVGRALGDSFEFPLTQTDLADALGITTVHANRTLQSLRSTEHITLERRRLSIHDVEGLKRIAMFDSRFLHLQMEGRQYSANE